MKACPKCGYTFLSQVIHFNPHNYNELAEYIYLGLTQEGYIPTMKEVNLMLALQHEYITKFILKEDATNG